MNNKLYPMDYITYKKKGKIPSEVNRSIKLTKQKGFHVLRLTPDEYNVPDEVKAYHAGFKHMKEITMKKIKKHVKNHPDTKGFFIAEGDLCINKDYDFKTFLKENHKKPIWLGYKKKLSNYIVGNFLLYFPVDYIDPLDRHFTKQKQLIYSDRFFTKLYNIEWLKLKKKSVATEIEHYSNVKQNIRTSTCHI